MKDNTFTVVVITILMGWMISIGILIHSNREVRRELIDCIAEKQPTVVTDTVTILNSQPVILQGEDGTTPYFFSYEVGGTLVNEVIFKYTDESAIDFGRRLARSCDMVEVSKGDFVIYRKVKTSEHGY